MTSARCEWEDCGIVLGSPTLLYEHLCNAHVVDENKEGRIYSCKWSTCTTKQSYGKTDAKRHAISHTTHRPFDCPQCNKSFKYKHALKSHACKSRGPRDTAEVEDITPPPAPGYKKRPAEDMDDKPVKRLRGEAVDVGDHGPDYDDTSAILAEMKADLKKQVEKDVTDILVETYTQVAAAKLQKMRDLLKNL